MLFKEKLSFTRQEINSIALLSNYIFPHAFMKTVRQDPFLSIEAPTTAVVLSGTINMFSHRKNLKQE